MPPKSGRKSSLDTTKQASLLSMWSGGPKTSAASKVELARKADVEDEVPGNLQQDLLNIFGHYDDTVNTLERLKRLSAEFAHKGRSKKRNRDSDEFLNDPEMSQSHSDASADEYGHKYVDMFCLLMDRGFGCPSRECKDQLMTIISNHEFHQSSLLSAKAASALGRMNFLYPAAKVGDDIGGLHVEENSGAWKLQDMTRVSRWTAVNEKARVESRPVHTDEWTILLRFVRNAQEAVESAEATDTHYAALLMLEKAVAAMYDDFASRLEVFQSRSESTSEKLWPVELLQNSYLGRLIELGEDARHRHELSEFVQGLVALIGQLGGCGDDEMDVLSDEDEPNTSDAGETNIWLVSPHEVAAVASDLLHIILEYLGILESSGTFYHARSAALYRTNLRVEVDIIMFDAYRHLSLPQKIGFLSALPARDKMRFVGSVIARFRAKRDSDHSNFPDIVRVFDIYDTQSSTVKDYVDVEFVTVLEYVASDPKYASDIKGVGGRDGLLSMICEGAGAAAEIMLQKVDAKQELAKLEQSCGKVFAALREGSRKPLLPSSIEKMCAAQVVVRHAVDSKAL